MLIGTKSLFLSIFKDVMPLSLVDCTFTCISVWVYDIISWWSYQNYWNMKLTFCLVLDMIFVILIIFVIISYQLADKLALCLLEMQAVWWTKRMHILRVSYITSNSLTPSPPSLKYCHFMGLRLGDTPRGVAPQRAAGSSLELYSQFFHCLEWMLSERRRKCSGGTFEDDVCWKLRWRGAVEWRAQHMHYQ